MKTRRASFAGSWYPGDADKCKREINQFLTEGAGLSIPEKRFVGGITPHAGWYFSGSIACNVIGNLAAPADLVVVYGMHLHPSSPAIIMDQGAWATPFGDLPVETDVTKELTKMFDFKIETTDSFTQDNTIELQLPFVKYFFKDAKIVTIGIPPSKESFEIGRAVAEITKRLGLETRVIGSTDLTHYGPNYGFEPKGRGKEAENWVRNENDKGFIDNMIAMDPVRVLEDGLKKSNACCSGAASTALVTVKALGAQEAHSIAYATSLDKHPGSSFVGYSGIVFS